MGKFMDNFGKPQGLAGRFIAWGMNIGHRSTWKWCLEQIEVPEAGRMLDVGCGGGGMLRQLVETYPKLHAEGIDHSEVCVEKSRALTEKFADRCHIAQGDVAQLPYEDNAFDLVTTMESLYFWGDLKPGFAQIHRVLKPGGTLLIGLEASDPTDTTWTSRIDNMRIYSPEELVALLQEAGFSDIKHKELEKTKLTSTTCIIGRKER